MRAKIISLLSFIKTGTKVNLQFEYKGKVWSYSWVK